MQGGIEISEIQLVANCGIKPSVENLDWTTWQLADSAFPAGGFAHSSGIEAAVQHGLIRDEAGVQQAIHAVVSQVVAGALPALNAVVRDPSCFGAVEDRLDATLSNHVARRASVAQGQALLSAAPRIFIRSEIIAWCKACRTQGTPGHFASVFGYLARELGMDASRAGELFVFMSMRSALSAAVRLGVVGPLRAQAIQQALTPETRATVSANADATLDDLHQPAPLLDVLQSGQDRLYSRLFQS